jgi:hypothetical protein
MNQGRTVVVAGADLGSGRQGEEDGNVVDLIGAPAEEIDALRMRKSLLLERLAAAHALAAEQDQRIADLRLALFIVPTPDDDDDDPPSRRGPPSPVETSSPSPPAIERTWQRELSGDREGMRQPQQVGDGAKRPWWARPTRRMRESPD